MITHEKLRRNLSSYLARPTSGRPVLRSVINQVVRDLPETAIFGGMIREFALGNARYFTSDIDLVSLAPQVEIESAIRGFSPVVNKFGGFRFVIDKQRFDIWSLESTWAFQRGYVVGNSFIDLLKTTFFNLDAACYDVKKNQLHLIDRYVDDANGLRLDINLVHNPNPRGMARKALSFALNKSLGMSGNLTDFIVRNFDASEATWSERRVLSQAIRFLDLGEKSTFRFDPQVEFEA